LIFLANGLWQCWLLVLRVESEPPGAGRSRPLDG
jgi:hypothetical protein